MKKKWTVEELEQIEKLIVIPGKGRHPEDIVADYCHWIQQGFDLTVEAIAFYLRCNYSFAHKHFTPHLRRVAINDPARNMLLTFGGDYQHLFTKRRLYSRQDFEKYILEQAQIVISREAYRLSDLSERSLADLDKWAKERKTTPRRLFANMAIGTAPPKKELEPVRYEQLTELPDQLLSMKDLVEKKFRYSSLAYRHIDRYAISKIKIGNLVRYDASDFEEDDDETIVFTLPTSIPKSEILASIERRLLIGDVVVTHHYLLKQIRL